MKLKQILASIVLTLTLTGAAQAAPYDGSYQVDEWINAGHREPPTNRDTLDIASDAQGRYTCTWKMMGKTIEGIGLLDAASGELAVAFNVNGFDGVELLHFDHDGTLHGHFVADPAHPHTGFEVAHRVDKAETHPHVKRHEIDDDRVRGEYNMQGWDQPTPGQKPSYAGRMLVQREGPCLQGTWSSDGTLRGIGLLDEHRACMAFAFRTTSDNALGIVVYHPDHKQPSWMPLVLHGTWTTTKMTNVASEEDRKLDF